MTNEFLEEQAQFFEFIKRYQYINDQGRFDLEAFCVNLSTCFACDGILELSPQPRDIYDLLIEIIEIYSENNEMSLWVQTQKLIDWSPEHAHMYPDKHRTLIHIAGLCKAMPHWIFEIGNTLMGIPRNDKRVKYYYWAKEEWTFVYTFVDGFHNFYYDFLKGFDKNSSKNSGFSLFEAFHRSKRLDQDYEKSIIDLKHRGLAIDEALKQIEKAIEEKFYLEAIALEECLISNLLYNYLLAHKKVTESPNFQNLIKKIKESNSSSKKLFASIDSWRKNRNKSIHGFITAKIESLAKSQDDFIHLSKKTAEDGSILCEKIYEWYIDEAVNFVPTKFEKNDRNYH